MKMPIKSSNPNLTIRLSVSLNYLSDVFFLKCETEKKAVCAKVFILSFKKTNFSGLKIPYRKIQHVFYPQDAQLFVFSFNWTINSLRAAIASCISHPV